MAQSRYSDLEFFMLLPAYEDMQRQPFARRPPYVSDGLVIIERISYIAGTVLPPYIANGLVIPLDTRASPAVSPPYIGRQQPMLDRKMQRPQVPQPFPRYQPYPHPHHVSAASQQANAPLLPPHSWRRANIALRQYLASLYPFNNPPPPQPSDDETQGIFEIGNLLSTSLHAHEAYIPSRRWHLVNIPPWQHEASLYPFNNPPPPQLSDEESRGLIEDGNPATVVPVILSLPSLVVSSSDEGAADCVICMEELDARDKITKLPCGHIFHINCVLSWLNIRKTCPLCRFELQADEEEFVPA